MAKNIITKGMKINKRTGEIDVRYVEWKKYIKTHVVPNVHARTTLGNVESVEEDAVGVEVEDERMDDETSEGESDNDTSTRDETMHDGEDYNEDEEDTKMESILL